MVSASRRGWTARVMSVLFGQAAPRAQSRTGESGRVDGRRTSCARRRRHLSRWGVGAREGLQRHGRVDEHGCHLRAVGRSPASLIGGRRWASTYCAKCSLEYFRDHTKLRDDFM